MIVLLVAPQTSYYIARVNAGIVMPSNRQSADPLSAQTRSVFSPVGQLYASSLLVTLMSRSSIAKELAHDQAALPEAGGDMVAVGSTAAKAPSTLVSLVLHHMMRKEEKRHPRADGQVMMTTTIQQVLRGEDDFDKSLVSISLFGRGRSLSYVSTSTLTMLAPFSLSCV